MERETRLELATSTLRRLHSSAELRTGGKRTDESYSLQLPLASRCARTDPQQPISSRCGPVKAQAPGIGINDQEREATARKV